MSVGQEFDPSLLENKDRSELVAIATSLGQKPPARAKKEAVIALIMELVGASDSAGASEDDQAEERSGGQDAAAEETPSAASAAGEGEDASDGDDGDAGDSSDDADASDDAEEPGSSDAGDAGEDGPQGGGQAQGGGGNDDIEPGNRRRRRRGRDRDRPRDEDAPAEPIEVEGLVDLREEGYGFLRINGYLASRDDVYVSVKQTRQFGLRTGDVVRGKARPANRNEKNPALLQVEKVNGHPAHQQPARRRFEELTAVFPDERLALETADASHPLARAIDLLAPIGKGQRGLITAPPRSGASTVLKEVARSIEANHADVELIVLLIDERPEELTDVKRSITRGEVAASAFDRPAEEHVTVAELVIERAKRLVEGGQDVVVLFDGLTRLTRAYNLAGPAATRPPAGTLDAGAIFPVKRFFGAARKAEEGGSLTILATAQVGTGSPVDEAILDELAGTANMELRLDRALADRGVFPAIDVAASSTRHDELLFEDGQLDQARTLRRVLTERGDEAGSNAAAVDALVERLDAAPTNEALLQGVGRG